MTPYGKRSMYDGIIFGAAALKRMHQEYPGIHVMFGKHESDEAFGLALSRPGWSVMLCGDCWVFAEDKGMGVKELHWFFPRGVQMPALRKILGFLFATGTEVLMGAPPEGHRNERLSRVVNRAIGALFQHGVYYLPRATFLGYTDTKCNM